MISTRRAWRERDIGARYDATEVQAGRRSPRYGTAVIVEQLE